MFYIVEPAKPLTPKDMEELRKEGLVELIVKLDGEAYCDEDLYICSNCDLRTVDKYDLDDEGDCDECAREACEEREYLQQLRSDYYASVF